MSVARALARGRRLAERQMTAKCIVRRKSGEAVVNYKPVPTYVVVYSGVCKPQSFRPQESSVGHLSRATRTVTRSEVHFPVGRFVAEVGDVVTVTESEHNPLLVGLHFRVVDDDLVTEHPTAYHVPVTRDAEVEMLPFEEADDD